MPTYVYECVRCGKFEQMQSMSERALEQCPHCGDLVKRIIAGGVGFVSRGRKDALADSCTRESPCCGRETRCDMPPCGK